MRSALVLTPMLPVLPCEGAGGKHRRIRIFLHAIARSCHRITLAQIVPARMLPLAGPALDASQSAFWGVDVTVRLLPRRTRVETNWNHYGAGILRATAQPPLHPFGGAGLAAAVGALLDAGPGLVFVDRLDAMLPLLDSGRRPRAVLLDIDDVYHKLRVRTALARPRRPGTLAAMLQAPALVALERRAVRAATVACVCSETDRRHLRALGMGPKVRAVPNAIAAPAAPPGVVAAQTALFLGAYHYGPNVLAAERLARQVWPLVRAALPEARLLIAGPQSELLPSHGAGLAGVDHLGFVDDLAALYAGARMVCCPITTGSGTRLKLIEAAAYARPMVSTRVGAEGLAFRDGAEILFAESDAALAQACIACLTDDALCRRIGGAGRERMLGLYEAAAVQRQVEGLVMEVMAERSTQVAIDASPPAI